MRALLWALAVLTAALLLLSFPVRARWGDGAADAMRIASFITLIIFLFLKQRPKNGRRSCPSKKEAL